jgi:adenylate cyclase
LTPLELGLIALALLLVAIIGTLNGRHLRERQRLHERLERSAGELQSLQLAFSRFAPDDVIERIIATGSADSGEKKTVTVLFADLVGFTALSESIEPALLVQVLNGYFERMSQAITDQNGYVSTLIGDGILALFGATTPNPWQENDAVHAAIAMRIALADYNRTLEADGLPTLSIGIGIHRGTGVAGLVGSRQRKEFAFVGRTVNVAARAQDLTRRLGGDIIVTEALRAQLDPRFELRALPDTQVKGVSRPLEIHAVVGYATGGGGR